MTKEHDSRFRLDKISIRVKTLIVWYRLSLKYVQFNIFFVKTYIGLGVKIYIFCIDNKILLKAFRDYKPVLGNFANRKLYEWARSYIVHERRRCGGMYDVCITYETRSMYTCVGRVRIGDGCMTPCLFYMFSLARKGGSLCPLDYCLPAPPLIFRPSYGPGMHDSMLLLHVFAS